MALDDKTRLVIDGLSILNDPRPNPAQPLLNAGIHLRWSFGPQSAFPLHGYYLFRRDYSEVNERCLSAALIGVKTGAVPGNVHDSWFGRAQSTALVAVDRFDPPGAVELALDDFPIEITFPAGVMAQKVRVTLGFGQWASGQMPQPRPIDVTLRHGTGPPTVTQLVGMPGLRLTANLRGEGITGVAIGKGPACLIELCYWFGFGNPIAIIWTGSSVPGPWHYVLGFPYPMTLPITHPLYPPRPGDETLITHRGDGPQRIEYGTANHALPLQAPTNGAGTISLTPGSPLAKGTNTAWDESLVGRILYPDTISTAFSIMAVPAPDRLVLSRPFTGGQPLQNVHYKWSDEDAFAQLHDQLGALLSEPNGMRKTAMPPPIERAAPQRTVKLIDGSSLAQGQGTNWTKDLEGLLLEPATTKALYRIVNVDVALQIATLHAKYIGPSATTQYRIVSRSPNNAVESQPALSISPLDYLELASLHPAYAQLLGLYWNDRSVVDEGPMFDYIVIADHEGRFQQRADLALKWLNTAADFSGTGVDGAMLTGIAFTASGALVPPANISIYALPGGTPAMTPDRPDLADSTPGLSIGDTNMPVMFDVWRYGHGTQEPPPGSPRPAQDHAQVGERFLPNRRKSDPAAPRPPGWPDPALIHFIDTSGGGLDVGWYSYRAGATDLWGRMSVLSAPIPWIVASDGTTKHPHAVHLEDRTPPPPATDLMAWLLEPDVVPDPSRVADAAYKAWRAQSGIGPNASGLRLRWRWPWSHQLAAPDLQEFRVYAQSTPINARFHKIVSVVAASGDPTRSDVTLAEADSNPADAYKNATLQLEERSFPIEKSTGGANLVLRVRNGGPTGSVPPASDAEATIVLPPGHALHRDLLDAANWERFLGVPAPSITYDIDPVEDPSVRLFDDPLNALHGSTGVWGQSRVRLDDLQSSLAGVRPGIDVIALGSDVTSLYAVLQIASVDVTQKEIVPVGGGPIWLTPGTYRWAIGPARKDARGTAATWNAALSRLDLDGNPDLSNVQAGADRMYVRVDAASTLQNLHHFFDIDDVDGTHLVLRGAHSYLTDGATYEWRIGKPVRIYELFLPSTTAGGPDDPKIDDWLNASLDEPVVYATIGVSGVDKRSNEGKLAGPATIFRVQRALPAAPPDDVWDASRLQATRADYRRKSFFTVRWKKPDAAKRPHYKAVVLRAMDETLFMEDFDQARTFPLALSIPSHWSASRAATVTAELSAQGAYGIIRGQSSLDVALPLYRALSDDAVAVLANLHGNEEAFSERTLAPLSLIDPANDDRRGPDDDLATFIGVSSNLNAWLDELDGLSQNRYLYKVAYVDSAHNRGPLGKSSPPVYLPKVVPPRAPVITKVLGGERQITLKWAANREPDLAGYRVYRTDDESKAAEVRSMDLVHSPGTTDVEWTDDDTNLVSGRKYFYRLTAVDTSGNESAPTRSHAGVAVDTRVPHAPDWTEQTWLLRRAWDGSLTDWPADNVVPAGFKPVLRLGFRSETPEPQFVMTRWRTDQPNWLQNSRATIRESDDASLFQLLDDDVDPNLGIAYRLKVRSRSGVWSTELAFLSIIPPPGITPAIPDEP